MMTARMQRQTHHWKLSQAIASFVGHLQGVGRAQNTLTSYIYDLQDFQKFWKNCRLSLIRPRDLVQYHEHLKHQGLRSNSRRRRLMTLRIFMGYLKKRKKINLDLKPLIIAPQRQLRVPLTVSQKELLQKIQLLPPQTPLEQRNRILLWILTETGLMVHEVTALKPLDFDWTTREMRIRGKRTRTLTLTRELIDAMGEVGSWGDFMFYGYNRFGPLNSAITPRGVELLTHTYAKILGFEKLTPRLIRHSVVMHWFEQGLPEDIIQKKLGLKSKQSLEIYGPARKATPRSNQKGTPHE